MVLRVALQGKGTLLLGDLSVAGLARLLAGGADLRSDVVVASGRSGLSRLWPEVRARVRPLAVVLTGGETPAARELASRIEREGTAVWATWRGGAVRIAPAGEGGWRPAYGPLR